MRVSAPIHKFGDVFVQSSNFWIPAFAGMTIVSEEHGAGGREQRAGSRGHGAGSHGAEGMEQGAEGINLLNIEYRTRNFEPKR